MQERDPGSIPGSGRSPGEGTGYPPQYSWASLVAQTVKHLPPVQEAAQRPGFSPWVGKIPLRRAWQPTPVFLPRESPWTEEPGGLQSVGSQRVGHNWVTTHTHTHANISQIMKFYNYLFLMALGLCCCVQAFSSCSKQGLPSSCGAQASYCNGFSCCQAWALGCMCFSSYSTWTQFLCSMWHLPGPGIEPMSPVLAGGLSTSGPPGKSKKFFIMQL